MTETEHHFGHGINGDTEAHRSLREHNAQHFLSDHKPKEARKSQTSKQPKRHLSGERAHADIIVKTLMKGWRAVNRPKNTRGGTERPSPLTCILKSLHEDGRIGIWKYAISRSKELEKTLLSEEKQHKMTGVFENGISRANSSVGERMITGC